MQTAAMLIALTVVSGSQSASDAIRSRTEEIRAALPSPGTPITPAARKRIENVVVRVVDLRAMLQASLGERWKELGEKQRKRLVAAFEARFRKVSSGELEPYRSTQIEYRPEVEGEGGVVNVPTRVVVKGEPTDIAYTMRRDDAGWRIVDITVDGVSTVENYRSSFAKVIKKNGVEGLIERLERGGSKKS